MHAPLPDRLGLKPVSPEPGNRRRLPNRRQAIRHKLEFLDPFSKAAIALYVTGGIDPADGTVREIFIRPGGAGGKNSLMERGLDDAAVALSHCLQRGMTVYDLAAALGHPEPTTSIASASPVAEAVIAATRMQADINSWPEGAAQISPSGEGALAPSP